MLMTAHGGSSSRQEMGNGDLLRIDGSGSCSCMSCCVSGSLKKRADRQYQLVDSIPASVGFNAME